jgi:hypothetical protein
LSINGFDFPNPNPGKQGGQYNKGIHQCNRFSEKFLIHGKGRNAIGRKKTQRNTKKLNGGHKWTPMGEKNQTGL